MMYRIWKLFIFKIVHNDGSCLIDIHMEYLENKCVYNIKYEPIYELDIMSGGYSVQFDASDVTIL